MQAESRFTSPEQFENIILRADANGTTVRLRDVARVELGPATYGRDTRLDGKPIAAFAVQVLPGADTLDVAKRVKAKMDELLPTLPPNISWFTPYDSTTFITISIQEVAKTLVEAMVLVFLTMLFFMQSFRATLIPTLVVPVALLGAFIGMKIFGFSINQLSMFGMVLAIGIVVDDAIVVIESVERLMREEHLSPKEATRKAMGQITGAIVTITVVLSAVFIPSAPAGRQCGRHLSPVRAHHRRVDGVLRIPRAELHACTVRGVSATGASGAELRLPLVQQGVRLGRRHLQQQHDGSRAPPAAVDGRVRGAARRRRVPVLQAARQLHPR